MLTKYYFNICPIIRKSSKAIDLFIGKTLFFYPKQPPFPIKTRVSLPSRPTSQPYSHPDVKRWEWRYQAINVLIMTINTVTFVNKAFLILNQYLLRIEFTMPILQSNRNIYAVLTAFPLGITSTDVKMIVNMDIMRVDMFDKTYTIIQL